MFGFQSAGCCIELGAKGVMELAATLGIRLDDEMKYIHTNKQQKTSIPDIKATGVILRPHVEVAKAIG